MGLREWQELHVRVSPKQQRDGNSEEQVIPSTASRKVDQITIRLRPLLTVLS